MSHSAGGVCVKEIKKKREMYWLVFGGTAGRTGNKLTLQGL